MSIDVRCHEDTINMIRSVQKNKRTYHDFFKLLAVLKRIGTEGEAPTGDSLSSAAEPPSEDLLEGSIVIFASDIQKETTHADILRQMLNEIQPEVEPTIDAGFVQVEAGKARVEGNSDSIRKDWGIDTVSRHRPTVAGRIYEYLASISKDQQNTA